MCMNKICTLGKYDLTERTDGRNASDAEQAWQFGETTGNKRKINKAHYNQARALNLISSILRT